jgi:hypothetical protein
VEFLFGVANPASYSAGTADGTLLIRFRRYTSQPKKAMSAWITTPSPQRL